MRLNNQVTFSAHETDELHFSRKCRQQYYQTYLTSRFGLQRAERDNLQSIGVQHHHAHIAACLLENNLPDRQAVIGVAFDGSGYGPDGAIWGGEFLVADYHGFIRAAHLKYIPLPGCDAATRQPYRSALSYLQHAGIEWTPDLAPINYARRTPLEIY